MNTWLTSAPDVATASFRRQTRNGVVCVHDLDHLFCLTHISIISLGLACSSPLVHMSLIPSLQQRTGRPQRMSTQDCCKPKPFPLSQAQLKSAPMHVHVQTMTLKGVRHI